MIQDILTYLTVFFAVGITLYNTYNIVFPKKKNTGANCGGCAGCDFKNKFSRFNYKCTPVKNDDSVLIR